MYGTLLYDKGSNSNHQIKMDFSLNDAAKLG